MTTTARDEGFDATGDCVRLAIDARVATILLDRPAKLNALRGVTRYPMRVKCATLAWHALRSALDEETN